MNRTRTPTQQTKKGKKVPECEDVELEFCKRALSLLTSLYEVPSTEEITTFPPSKKVDVPPQEKKLAFNSNIVDLRLKKAQDAQAQNHATLNEQIAQRVEELSSELRASNVNLDDVFVPSQVDRPDVPLYIQNIERDERRKAFKKKKRVEPMDMMKIQAEYQERLLQSQLKGTEKLQKRLSKIMNNENAIPPTTYHHINHEDKFDYRKRENERKKAIAERRAKQVSYMKPEDYKKLVKPRKVEISSTTEYSEDEE